MSATKIIFPEDYEKRLYALTNCYAMQGCLLNDLLKHYCFFESEGGLKHQEVSSRLIVELDEQIAESSLFMDDLIGNLELKSS